MGQEIHSAIFSDKDFAEFHRRLARETDLLAEWLDAGAFADTGSVGGYELEAWLVDRDGLAAPENEAFLAALDSPLVVPELARFNVEINAAPHRLEDGTLSRMHAELGAAWTRCQAVANSLGIRMMAVGILPTVRKSDLNLDNMSSLKRYRALNEQIFRLRHGEPIRLRIDGPDPLDVFHEDVMLESAATSFQIHLKVAAAEGPAVFNASKILSAPIVAVAANSPYLFGHDLWQETRIPLFEQAVAVGGSGYGRRVSFGRDYVKGSLLECFEANRDQYPVLLPRLSEAPETRLAHLRLHNGKIWRWNRPLIGFDNNGTPHFRIEHRVIPAGPTITDMIANTALYFGAVTAMSRELGADVGGRLNFDQARANFYAAARGGLDAEITWLDQERGTARDVLLERVLPQASEGLEMLGISSREAGHWLGIIEQRARTGHTGAWWQESWVRGHGADMRRLTEAYLSRQSMDEPVHTWRAG